MITLRLSFCSFSSQVKVEDEHERAHNECVVREADNPLRFMRGWSIWKVITYCATHGWKVEFVDAD